MHFIKNSTTYIAVIAVITLLALGAIFTYGVKLSPDFTGGSIVEIAFTGEGVTRPSQDVVVQALTDASAESVTVREAGDASLIVRMASLTPEQQSAVTTVITEDLKGTIARMNTVGPVIGSELYRKGAWAVLFVSLSILAYVAFAFRPQGKMKVKKDVKGASEGLTDVSSWWYGSIAIVTLAHDILVPTGVIAILGYLYGIEADTLFITAILTILGYSVNDTIVIFDRIREKVRVLAGKTQHIPTFSHVVGEAVSETYGRSINTSLTTLIALVALYIFGPETTKMFALAMGLGVVAGTYSSIALAAPLLVLAHEKTVGKK